MAEPAPTETLRKMLEARKGWLASCERVIELLTPEWDKFQARTGHNTYVSRLYADHFSEARKHRSEIEALEAVLLPPPPQQEEGL